MIAAHLPQSITADHHPRQQFFLHIFTGHRNNNNSVPKYQSTVNNAISPQGKACGLGEDERLVPRPLVLLCSNPKAMPLGLMGRGWWLAGFGFCLFACDLYFCASYSCNIPRLSCSVQPKWKNLALNFKKVEIFLIPYPTWTYAILKLPKSSDIQPNTQVEPIIEG